MANKKIWRIWCVTEATWKNVPSETSPTVCPTDGGHTVDLAGNSIKQDHDLILEPDDSGESPPARIVDCDSEDVTKQTEYDLSNITTGTKRKINVPDKDGTLYDAQNIQGKAVDPTVPTNDQSLLFDTAGDKYKAKTITKALVGLGNADNTSDVNKPVSTATQTALDAKIPNSEKGAANGVATLGGDGKVPAGQLNLSTWNATTNTPTLSDSGGGGDKGDYYTINVAGSTSIDGITDWKVKDIIINNGTIWEKIDNTDQVTSVAGKQGAVTLVAADTTDFDAEVSNNTDVAANTTDRHTHSNKTQLDLVSDGDHDIISSGNPHSVDKTDVGLSNVQNLKVNLTATTDPGATDDSASGYAVGSRWINVTLDKGFVCVDSTVSAAVWKETTASGGGGDADAIHDNVSGEISLITEKTSPAAADLLIMEDSAASNAKKKVQISNLLKGVTKYAYFRVESDTVIGVYPVKGISTNSKGNVSFFVPSDFNNYIFNFPVSNTINGS